MSKKEKVEKLTKELIDLLKEGNITIEEVVGEPEILVDHPDFDSAIDILATLDEILYGDET